jgi:hypothetical protein
MLEIKTCWVQRVPREKPSKFGRIIIPRVKEEDNVLALMSLDFEPC